MGGYTTEFAGSTQNVKKLGGTSNQPIRTKKIVPQKCKGAKNSYGSYPTELAGSTQNVKKIVATSNHPIRTKKHLSKSMFSTLKV
jgi:hypothetical protein